MSKSVFRLDMPPSVNHYWERSRNGRLHLGKRAKDYRRSVFLALREQLGIIKPKEGQLHLTVIIYPPNNRRRDIDNILKPLLDALEHANLYADDSQIRSLHVLFGRMNRLDPGIDCVCNDLSSVCMDDLTIEDL